MYFIRKGHAGYLVRDLVFQFIMPGSYFGDIELMKIAPRKYTVKAITGLKLLVLSN